MEEAYKALKAFILSIVNAALPSYESEGVSLPLLTEETTRFGVVDPLKIAGETLCAILPESVEFDGGYISGEGTADYSVIVAFFCRQAAYPTLLARADRYARCFRECLKKDTALEGRAINSEIGRIEFDPDCGIADRQAAACEIEMTITFRED